MALKRITSNYEIVGYSEIDKHAIHSYHAIHGDVKAYGDITKMKEIPPCDIFTYSFPCSDLSKAGKQKGMTKDTRSGLVYEVLRLVRDTKDKPKVLIMENVPDLIQANFVRQFGKIQLELERMGYMNYVDTLNAKDFGVAQNRDRVFMVSVLGEYSYSFPRYVKLEKRLKDYLEDEVDEKYYLSDKQLEQISNWNAQQNPLENAKSVDDESVQCITAKSNTSMNSSMLLIKEKTDETICLNSKVNGKQPSLQDRIYDIDGVSTAYMPSIATNNLRIRKLTPREVWRLMGISDEDFNKAQASGVSNSQLYKQAGNAICVPVFEAILNQIIERE